MATPRRHASPHTSPGFTLLEIAVVLAISAILLAVAVPNYSRSLQRQQLRGAADALRLDMSHARELSVRTGQEVFISFQPGKSWCWGVSSGQACDCSGASPLPACSISRGQRSDYPDVRLDSAAEAEFEPGRGLAPRHGAVVFSTAQQQTLRLQLSGMGRTQVCGPDALGAPPC